MILDLLRLPIPVRHALSRLTMPVMIVAAVALLLIGKADMLIATRLRMALGDSLAPIYAVLTAPTRFVRFWVAEAGRTLTIMHDNATLRAENDQLRKWQSVALALDDENAALRRQLHWIPDAAPSFVTTRAVADTGGIYARSVLVATGPTHFVAKGQIALDDRGLVGRVTEVGARSARVLLITDLNSRIPVTLAESHARAIMVGTNADDPRLIFLPQDAHLREGERVLTSGEAGIYPAGLPVGTLHVGASNVPEVVPEARLGQLDVVRLFDYGLQALVPPEAPIRARPGAATSATQATAPQVPASWHTAPDRFTDNLEPFAEALRAHARLAQQQQAASAAHPPVPAAPAQAASAPAATPTPAPAPGADDTPD